MQDDNVRLLLGYGLVRVGPNPRPLPNPPSGALRSGKGRPLVGGSLVGKSVSSSGAVRFVGGVHEVYEFC